MVIRARVVCTIPNIIHHIVFLGSSESIMNFSNGPISIIPHPPNDTFSPLHTHVQQGISFVCRRLSFSKPITMSLEQWDEYNNTAASESAGEQVQGEKGPAMPTQSDPDLDSDEEEGPSGEDVESINANAREIPCGEDHMPLSLFDLKAISVSVRREEAIASKPNETPVDGSEVGCDKPCGQDEAQQSRMPLQSEGSNEACGQGKAPAITIDACTGSENLPTNMNSSFATTGVPLESVSDNVPDLDDSATSLDVNKANVTSTVLIESSPPSGEGASVAGVPCINAPLGSASDSCSVLSTPAKCYDELSGAGEGGSPTGQKIAAAFDSSSSYSGDPVPTDHDVNPDNAACEHIKAIEMVDTHIGPESEECRPSAVPDGIVISGAELAYQRDGLDAALVSSDDCTNSPAIIGADEKADDDALPIDPNVLVLALNAAVEEVEHDAPEPPESVPNVTPITLESSFIDFEQELWLHVGLADAEIDIFQVQAPLDAIPFAAQRDGGNSAPVFPPLPAIPLGDAQLQPVFPPLPALPSTSTPMVIIPVTHAPP